MNEAPCQRRVSAEQICPAGSRLVPSPSRYESRQWGLCIDGQGNILVCDYQRGVVQQFSIEGCFTGKSVAKLQSPRGIAVMLDGRFLVSDNKGHKVFIMK